MRAKKWQRCRRCRSEIMPGKDTIERVEAFGWVHTYCQHPRPPQLTPEQHLDLLRSRARRPTVLP